MPSLSGASSNFNVFLKHLIYPFFIETGFWKNVWKTINGLISTNVFSYIEVGFHWLAYQMDVNTRRIMFQPLWKPSMKKWSQNKGIKGENEGGTFIYNYIFEVLCNLKFLASLQNFKSTCGRVWFSVKLQVFNCNCSEKSTPLQVFLRFCIHVNGPKSQNAWNIYPLLSRQQFSPMIVSFIC